MEKVTHSFKDRIFNSLTNVDFEHFALDLFDFQFKYNDVYSAYVENLDIKRPKCVEEIPFLPIQFFKTHKILTKKLSFKRFFESSGTTANTKSRHYIYDIALYERSFMQNFISNYGKVNQYCILSLLPSFDINPNSSLVYMVNTLIEKSGHSSSGFYLDDFKKLYYLLNDLDKKNQKTILIGLSYAFLDFLKEYQLDTSNLIIIETGGMKGRKAEITKNELHAKIKNGFGVDFVHSEYGMTEILSQAYSRLDDWFTSPPWMKIFTRSITDPFSFINNKTGLINIIDLANIYSCSFIATDDLGIVQNEKFKVLGRHDYADVRGCNLMIGNER